MSDQDKLIFFNKKSKRIAGLGKKIADLLDEFWKSAQNIFSKERAASFGALITGVTGFLVNLLDGYKGAKDTYRGYRGDYKTNPRLRTTLAVVSFITALIGTTLSVGLIAGYCGVSVFGYPLLSVIVSALLLTNSFFGLIKQGFCLYEAKRKEEQARRNLEEACNSFEDIDSFKQAYKNAIEHRFAIERNMVFKGLEIAATSVLLVAGILGTVAFVGAASVASFGVLPIVMSVAALTSLIIIKAFQANDKEENHYYTKKIRGLFFKEPDVDLHHPLDHDDIGKECIELKTIKNSTAQLLDNMNKTIIKKPAPVTPSLEVTSFVKKMITCINQDERHSQPSLSKQNADIEKSCADIGKTTSSAPSPTLPSFVR